MAYGYIDDVIKIRNVCVTFKVGTRRYSLRIKPGKIVWRDYIPSGALAIHNKAYILIQLYGDSIIHGLPNTQQWE